MTVYCSEEECKYNDNGCCNRNAVYIENGTCQNKSTEGVNSIFEQRVNDNK